MKPILEVELVPKGAWGSNLRKFLSDRDWKKVCTATLERAQYKCEACGQEKINGSGNLETHETWEFNIETRVQRLISTRSLCKKCHGAIHLGLSQLLGYGKAARLQLETVNNWTPMQRLEHEKAVVENWKKLNTVASWRLDVHDYLQELIPNDPSFAEFVFDLTPHPKRKKLSKASLK